MSIKTKARIKDSVDVKDRIEELEIRMKKQERQLKKDMKEVYYSLHFTTMLKNLLKDVRQDPELKSAVAEASMNLGAQFVLDRLVFRKHHGLRAFLISAGLKKVIGLLIAKNKEMILKKAGI